MKYPYEISAQALLLLSKEDKAIYDYEHSDFFSYTERQEAILAYKNALLEKQGYYELIINDDMEYDTLSEDEKVEMALELARYDALLICDELCEIMRSYIGSEISVYEYNNIKHHLLKELSTINPVSVNEDVLAPGVDFLEWTKGTGWLGKLVVGLFSTMLIGVISLIMKGKDKAAMHELEKYMNRLVEKVDDGLYKKKSTLGKFLGRFGFGKEDGDLSKACFRMIQENFSKKIASDSMVLLKNMGFLSNSWEHSIKDIESNRFENGGMEAFMQLIARPVSKLTNKI